MNRYKAFLTVLELGSFTAAAGRLGYSQSAVSKMILSLEEELGIHLLSRSRTGLSLTPEGERILPAIRSTVSQYDSMRSIADEIRGFNTGEIRIGVFASISVAWLAPMIGEFRKLYPGITFDLRQGDYSSITSLVRSGELDMGFISREAAGGLSEYYLKSDEYLLVLPEDHRLASRVAIRLEEIADETFFMVRAGEKMTYSEVIEAFDSAGVFPQTVLQIHDDYTILSMVEMGYGISILSEKIIDYADANVAVCHIDPPVYRHISIVTRDPSLVPAATRRFADFLIEHLDQLP